MRRIYFVIHHQVEGEDHIVRGDGLAVRPDGVGKQVEDQLPAIFTHFPLAGQTRHILKRPFEVDPAQRLEDLVRQASGIGVA